MTTTDPTPGHPADIEDVPRGSMLTLLRAIVTKQAILLIRYPVNTLSQIVSIYLIFGVIFFGGRAVAGQALTDSLSGIIVGFFLFTMVIVSYSGLSWSITREAQWGTLEQLYMSPYGFGRVMILKVCVDVAFSFLWGAVILVLMLLTTGESLSVDVLTVGPLILLTLASAVGIGFVFAGAAILYKRIENVFQLVQYGFIGLIAAPVHEYPLLRFLPVSQGSALLQTAMNDGVALWHLPVGDLGVLVGTAVVYAGLGYLVFKRATARARRLGVMGQY
jgi:ABC-2 type transport system permease protein